MKRIITKKKNLQKIDTKLVFTEKDKNKKKKKKKKARLVACGFQQIPEARFYWNIFTNNSSRQSQRLTSCYIASLNEWNLKNN